MDDSGSPSVVRSSLRLLLNAKAGDPCAVESLCCRNLAVMRRWAHGRLPRWARNLVNTDDIVQETIINAVDKFGSFEYRHEGAVEAYLRQGVRNRILDEIRKAKRSPQFTSLPEREASEPSPLELAIGTEALERYEAALARLKPEEQQAIITRIEMSLSYAEIAEALGKPSPDAARMAVSRAIVRLAEEMAGGRR
jgi:RNA polymerase sigma-70 factor (ECF subfamily)